jgi:protein SCO1
LKLNLYQTKAGAAMNKNVLSCLILLLLAACNATPSQPPLSEAPLAGARIGGPFSLIDQDGKRRSDAEFMGKYRMLYFGYTKCPDICTPDMQQLMAGLQQFEKSHPALAGKIQPIFITVDPARDTPELLKQFVTAFHPRLIGLTGTDEEIAQVAKAFAISFAKQPGTSADEYPVSHTQMSFLMSSDGKPLALLPADALQTEANEGTPEAVATELAKWVR